jgi:ABC-type lipoprotein export system ATPase subunit
VDGEVLISTPGETSAQLVARSISHSFAATQVLSSVDLAVSVGQSVALAGPSGSGKSTLLMILGGLLRPDHGRVEVQRPAGTSPVRGSVAWILQTTNAFGQRSALSNVLLGALCSTAGFEAKERAAIDLMTSLGLAEVLHQPARKLSGGELQRVSVARALLADATFILADEPTGQLDHRTSRIVLDAMFSARSGQGLIMASHDAEVWERCDVVYHLVDGHLVPGSREERDRP